jgi:HEAT repeat protein
MRKCLALVLTSLTLFAACRGSSNPDVAGLVAALQSGDAEKSGRANLELIRLGEPAVPGLIEMLKDPDPRVRGLAASTFWGMGGKARSAVPALAEALSDPDPAFRTQIAMALENMGPDAKDAVPALIKALSDPDRGVRQASVKALGRIGPGARAAVPALSRALKMGSWPEAQEAILLINGGKLDTTSGDPIVPKP